MSGPSEITARIESLKAMQPPMDSHASGVIIGLMEALEIIETERSTSPHVVGTVMLDAVHDENTFMTCSVDFRDAPRGDDDFWVSFLSSDPTGHHPILRSLIDKRVRVTVEVLGTTI